MMQVKLVHHRSSKTVENDQVFRLSGNVISLIRSFLAEFHGAGHVVGVHKMSCDQYLFEGRLQHRIARWVTDGEAQT